MAQRPVETRIKEWAQDGLNAWHAGSLSLFADEVHSPSHGCGEAATFWETLTRLVPASPAFPMDQLDAYMVFSTSMWPTPILSGSPSTISNEKTVNLKLSGNAVYYTA